MAALQLAELSFHGAINGRRCDLPGGTRGGKLALHYQPAPGEQLVSCDTILTGDERDA